MLDSSVFLENSGGGASGGSASDGVAAELRNEDGGGGGEGDPNSAGTRWPREETLALLKIRSDMDLAFRDSNLKAPLWDEVSRSHFQFQLLLFFLITLFKFILYSSTCFHILNWNSAVVV